MKFLPIAPTHPCTADNWLRLTPKAALPGYSDGRLQSEDNWMVTRTHRTANLTPGALGYALKVSKLEQGVIFYTNWG